MARTLELVGERWTFLILRDALLDVRRFDRFLGRLGIARNVLTDRLNRLVDNGILHKVAYQQRPLRHEYVLTRKGLELGPVIITLMEWGDRHLAGEAGPPRVAEHRECGGHVVSQMFCESCVATVPLEQVTTRPATSRSVESAPVPSDSARSHSAT